MSRRLSLPGRRHFDGLDTASVPLVLMEITHPEMNAPLRLSTDMTERLSTDPLRYGTRCGWRGADLVEEPWLFVGVDVEWPGEIEDTMPEARLTLSLVQSSILDLLRSILTPATCHMALMLSGHLGAGPEEVYLDLELRSAEADLSAGGRVELVLSHVPIDIEMFPSPRMTQRAFPGLYR
ncbi:hypothetical protein [Sagittula salina]|uniref:DUF1833 domain-containing protein n=1 Tax=Sagittula salina TaxID=2820268 RepID=A0A940S2C1_9RHOB|nr:hypothetical protein [Sagittula salina]MBP0483936.1 hypothetical protein [Sagittula salina]